MGEVESLQALVPSRDRPSLRSSRTAQRRNFDFYATPPDLIQALIERSGVKILGPVWECAAGDGRLGRALEAAGHRVVMSDILPAGPGIDQADFFTAPIPPGIRSILTNPPFAVIDKFIRRGLEHLDAGRVEQLILLARHDVDMAAGRAPLLARASQRIVCCWRPRWIEGTTGTGRWAFSWWVWQANSSSDGPVIQYLNPVRPPRRTRNKAAPAVKPAVDAYAGIYPLL